LYIFHSVARRARFRGLLTSFKIRVTASAIPHESFREMIIFIYMNKNIYIPFSLKLKMCISHFQKINRCQHVTTWKFLKMSPLHMHTFVPHPSQK
jgi:hypothetical protein